MIESYPPGEEKHGSGSFKANITYDPYEPDQIERITRFADEAPPGYNVSNAQRASYAAIEYLAPLTPEEKQTMTVVSTRGALTLSDKEQAEMLTRAITMSRDQNPEPSMLVLDPEAKDKRKEDGKRTVILPFVTGSRKVWIIKDDFGDPDDPESVPREYRDGVKGRYLVTCLLPEEY